MPGKTGNQNKEEDEQGNKNESQVNDERKKLSSNRGFAVMDNERQKEIAKKGGEAVSKNRRHMAEIGRKGGEAVSGDREHMAEIGRKGGESRGNRKKDDKNEQG